MSPTVEPISFLYRFNFSDGKTKEFKVHLNRDTLALLSEKKPTYPEWTRLSFKQCTNCPLREKDHPHCPVAVNLAEVIEFFKETLSYEMVDVEIVTKPRIYKKKISAQDALGSLMGIYMVTSGCPILDKLRPLVRTHLPFATLEETTYRVVSMYLLAQFFLYQQGKPADWELRDLPKIFGQIQIVNRCFSQRLREVQTEDANTNAVVFLDCYADYTTTLLSEPALNQLKKLFSAHLSNL